MTVGGRSGADGAGARDGSRAAAEAGRRGGHRRRAPRSLRRRDLGLGLVMRVRGGPCKRKDAPVLVLVLVLAR